MRKEVFKVNEEDYKLLQRIKAVTLEDKQNLRLENIEINKRKINQFKRLIKHKEDQIYKKESLEKHEGYLDDKKPLFMLQNEIEEIQAQINQLERANKNSKEEYDKAEKEK